MVKTLNQIFFSTRLPYPPIAHYNAATFFLPLCPLVEAGSHVRCRTVSRFSKFPFFCSASEELLYRTLFLKSPRDVIVTGLGPSSGYGHDAWKPPCVHFCLASCKSRYLFSMCVKGAAAAVSPCSANTDTKYGAVFTPGCVLAKAKVG